MRIEESRAISVTVFVLGVVLHGRTAEAGQPGVDIAQVQADGVQGSQAAIKEHGILGRVGQGFRQFASPSNLAVLGIGGAAALAIHPYDHRLTDDLQRSEGLDRFFEIGDVAGGGLVQIGGALATYAVGGFSHNREVRSLGGDLIAAQADSGTLTLALKLAVGRSRPDGTGYSFPSGHTSASFATATVLQRHYGWKLGVPAYVLATYIGASRLQENKHFASDVLFGAAIGVAAGRGVTFGRGRTHVALTPCIVPGGVGLALVSFRGTP